MLSEAAALPETMRIQQANGPWLSPQALDLIWMCVLPVCARWEEVHADKDDGTGRPMEDIDLVDLHAMLDEQVSDDDGALILGLSSTPTAALYHNM